MSFEKIFLFFTLLFTQIFQCCDSAALIKTANNSGAQKETLELCALEEITIHARTAYRKNCSIKTMCFNILADKRLTLDTIIEAPQTKQLLAHILKGTYFQTPATRLILKKSVPEDGSIVVICEEPVKSKL